MEASKRRRYTLADLILQKRTSATPALSSINGDVNPTNQNYNGYAGGKSILHDNVSNHPKESDSSSDSDSDESRPSFKSRRRVVFQDDDSGILRHRWKSKRTKRRVSLIATTSDGHSNLASRSTNKSDINQSSSVDLKSETGTTPVYFNKNYIHSNKEDNSTKLEKLKVNKAIHDETIPAKNCRHTTEDCQIDREVDCQNEAINGDKENCTERTKESKDNDNESKNHEIGAGRAANEPKQGVGSNDRSYNIHTDNIDSASQETGKPFYDHSRICLSDNNQINSSKSKVQFIMPEDIIRGKIGAHTTKSDAGNSSKACSMKHSNSLTKNIYQDDKVSETKNDGNTSVKKPELEKRAVKRNLKDLVSAINEEFEKERNLGTAFLAAVNLWRESAIIKPHLKKAKRVGSVSLSTHNEHTDDVTQEKVNESSDLWDHLQKEKYSDKDNLPQGYISSSSYSQRVMDNTSEPSSHLITHDNSTEGKPPDNSSDNHVNITEKSININDNTGICQSNSTLNGKESDSKSNLNKDVGVLVFESGNVQVDTVNSVSSERSNSGKEMKSYQSTSNEIEVETHQSETTRDGRGMEPCTDQSEKTTGNKADGGLDKTEQISKKAESKPGQTETNGKAGEGEPSLSETTGKDVEVEPGHSETTDNKVEGEPGHSETTDNKVECKAGHSETTDNKVECKPGHSETTDNKVECKADHSETTDNKVECKPGHSETTDNKVEGEPGHSETTDNRVEGEPGHSETTDNKVEGEPGHSETTDNKVEGEPGHSETTDNRVECEPGHSETTDNKVEGEPGHSETTYNKVEGEPGQSETTGNKVEGEPGQSETTDNKVEDEPGRSETTYNKVEGEPGHSETTDNKVEGEPGQSETTDNKVECKPGQSETTDNKVEGEPGHSETTYNKVEGEPGQSETTDNKVEGEPGHSETTDNNEMINSPSTLRGNNSKSDFTTYGNNTKTVNCNSEQKTENSTQEVSQSLCLSDDTSTSNQRKKIMRKREQSYPNVTDSLRKREQSDPNVTDSLSTTSNNTSKSKQIQIIIRNSKKDNVDDKIESSIKIIIKIPETPTGSQNDADEFVFDNDKHDPTKEEQDVKEQTTETLFENNKSTEDEYTDDISNNKPPRNQRLKTHIGINEFVKCTHENKSTEIHLPNIEGRGVKRVRSADKESQLTRFVHSSSGRRKMIMMSSSTFTSPRPQSVKKKEVDGVVCSDDGVFIGRDLKLYQTYQEASSSSRVNKILEEVQLMKQGILGKSLVASDVTSFNDDHWKRNFLCDEDEDSVFVNTVTKLPSLSMNKYGSRTSRVTGKRRKERAYSQLRKKLIGLS